MEAHGDQIRKNIEAIKENMREDLRKEFNKLDADGDGSLTLEEFRNFIESAKQNWEGFHEAFFDGLDTNKDQKVSFEGKSKYRSIST